MYPPGYSTVGEYRKDIGGSERKCCARLVEYRIKVHWVRFPSLKPIIQFYLER